MGFSAFLGKPDHQFGSFYFTFTITHVAQISKREMEKQKEKIQRAKLNERKEQSKSLAHPLMFSFLSLLISFMRCALSRFSLFSYFFFCLLFFLPFSLLSFPLSLFLPFCLCEHLKVHQIPGVKKNRSWVRADSHHSPQRALFTNSFASTPFSKKKRGSQVVRSVLCLNNLRERFKDCSNMQECLETEL